MHVPSKWSPLAQAYLWSAVMQAIPATRAIVGHDPQKLLPAPSPFNRPMSLWDTETLLASLGDLMGTSYERMASDFEAMMPKPAKPRRYYIEGGHFDMQPPGTFDLDDETIQFEGTPTGRRLAPFVAPIRRPQHKVAVIAMAGLDFGRIEARVLAAMSDKRVRGVIIDIESAGGEIINPQLDLYRMAFAEKPRAEKVAKKAPPAYLQHDPTKRHKRRRKGK
jgi:hypothetical protein